jgi:hypothetical protein
MRIFQMTLNINGFVQERTENCGGGWLAYILKARNIYNIKCKNHG